ncbi:MAG: tail fiber protein [Bacteroidales bacterium]
MIEIKFLGKLSSTDLLPTTNNNGDSYEIDGSLYTWTNGSWEVSDDRRKNKLRAIELTEVQAGGIEGPQGPRGYTWKPAVDWYGNIMWNIDESTTPPDVVNIKGPQGEIGPRGPRGLIGPTGPQGIQGEKGAAGEQGTQGPRGYVGEQGPQGIQGPKGDIGPKGNTGLTGDKGDQGVQGEQGLRGVGVQHRWQGTFLEIKREDEEWGTSPAVNLIGPQGIQGLAGPIGPTGTTGPQGAQGDQGIPGPQGIQGIKGEKGDTGSGITVLGRLSSESELVDHTPGMIGDGWVIGTDLYVWTIESEWVNVGQLSGPKGEQGDIVNLTIGKILTVDSNSKASASITGEGKDKVLNINIPKGAQGEVGASNTLTVSSESVSSSSTASATISGVSPSQHIHFQIPAGERGLQGKDGSRGKSLEFRYVNSNGEKVDDNPTHIQIRQEDGAWSAPVLIKGKDGEKGEQGLKGDKGNPVELTTSIEAVEWFEPASIETSGEPGFQHIHFSIPRGEKGEQGLNGETGPQGPMGPQGLPGVVDTTEFYNKTEIDGMIEKIEVGGSLEYGVFKTGIAINTSGKSGIELNGTQTNGIPQNGIINTDTATLGVHGKVVGDYANYLKSEGVDSGWIFRNNGYNVGSISNDGMLAVNSIEVSNGITTKSLKVADPIFGSFVGDLDGNITGTSSSAAKLTNKINISLIGGVTGTVEFDGSESVAMVTELNGVIGLVDNTANNLTPNDIKEGMYGSIETKSGNLMPGESTHNTVISIKPTPDDAGNWLAPVTQIGFINDKMKMRQSDSKVAWKDWWEIYSDKYHPVADKWTAPIRMSFTGGATGVVEEFNGAKDIDINLSIVNDSHTHDLRYYTKEYFDEMYDKAIHDRGTVTNLDLIKKQGKYHVEAYTHINAPFVGPNTGELLVFLDQNNGTVIQQMIMKDGRQAIRFLDTEWSIWNYMYNDLYHPQADKLTTPRKINNVDFDGTKDITITADPNDHVHSADDITTGILPIERGGTGTDGTTIDGFLKYVPGAKKITSQQKIHWNDLDGIPPELGGNGDQEGILELPDATLTQKGIVQLSDKYELSNTEAATPALVTRLKTAFDSHNHDTLYAPKVHTHVWSDIKNDTVPRASILREGIVQLANTKVPDSENPKKFAATAEWLQKESDVLTAKISSANDKIAELEQSKAEKVHIHKASDITSGVFSYERGGTGATDFTAKYIINSGKAMSSINTIPLFDIDLPEELKNGIAPKIHTHNWSDINANTIPKASESVSGIIKVSSDIDNPATDIAASLYALKNLSDRINEGTADKDHTHDDRYAMKEHQHNWTDIVQSTIPKASEKVAGIVMISDSISNESTTVAATAGALKRVNDKIDGAYGEFAPKVHKHSAMDITTGVLPTNRGGTGNSVFYNGIIKYLDGKFESYSKIEIGDINNIYNTFTQFGHTHEWEDILNPPKASEKIAGIVKLTNDDESSSIDHAATARMVYDLRTLVGNMTFDGYTKAESDGRYKYNVKLLSTGDNCDRIDKSGYCGITDVYNTSGIVGLPVYNKTGILNTTKFDNIRHQEFFVTNDSGAPVKYIRSSPSGEFWTDWGRVWTSADFGDATETSKGIFLIEKTALRMDDTRVPTSKVVLSTIEEKLNQLDAFEPAFRVLPVNKGGTGTSNFTVDNGIVRVFIDEGEEYYLDSVSAIDWSEVSNVPISSITNQGIVKLSNNLDDTSISDAATIATVNKLYKMITQDSDSSAYVKKSGDTMTGNLKLPNVELTTPSSTIKNSSNSNIVTTVVRDTVFGNSGGMSIIESSNNPVVRIGGSDHIIYHEGNKPGIDEGTVGVLPIARGGTGVPSFSNKYIIREDTGARLSSIAKIPWSDIELDTDEDGNIIPPGGGGGGGDGGFVPADHKHPWTDIKPETIPRTSDGLGTEGIVVLNDTTNSNSVLQGATANAVKKANDNANTRVSRSGDVMTGDLSAPNLVASEKVTAKEFNFGGARIVFNPETQSLDFIID